MSEILGFTANVFTIAYNILQSLKILAPSKDIDKLYSITERILQNLDQSRTQILLKTDFSNNYEMIDLQKQLADCYKTTIFCNAVLHSTKMTISNVTIKNKPKSLKDFFSKKKQIRENYIKKLKAEYKHYEDLLDTVIYPNQKSISKTIEGNQKYKLFEYRYNVISDKVKNAKESQEEWDNNKNKLRWDGWNNVFDTKRNKSKRLNNYIKILDVPMKSVKDYLDVVEIYQECLENILFCEESK